MSIAIGHNGATPRVLPLSIQERDGHVTIYCDARQCFWSWPLYDEAPETNGRAIASAVRHVHKRHPDQDDAS